jgi:hypothetical protein
MSTGVSSSSKKESKPSSSSKANDHSDYTTQSSSLSPNRIVAFMIYHSDYTTQSSSLSPKRNTQSPLQQQQSKGSIRVGSTHFATSVAPQSASDQWYVPATADTLTASTHKFAGLINWGQTALQCVASCL